MNGRRPPNIILINTDQQRYDTIKALGYPYMVTPNLDRLVEEGVTFTNCFVGAPACGPNRASLFSGYYPHTTGMGKNGDLWQKTWVSLLGKAGYYTANVGKMHLTPFDAKAGFDYRFNVENKQRFRQWALHEDEWDRGVMAHGLRKPEREDYEKRPGYEEELGAFEWELPDELQSDMFLGDAAVRWIERYQLDQPFFLEIGFPGPHPPYDPIDRWREEYEDKDLPLLEVTEAELEAQPEALKQMHVHNTEVAHDSVFHILRPTHEQRLRQRRYYMANVSMIDEKVGEIVAALEKRGFMENAVLFFTSDHGDTLTDHGSSQKWTMYDIVTRVPTIAWAPGRFEGGRKVEDQYQWMDLGPTVLELAGVEAPETYEAISMLPALNGEAAAEGREYVFAEHDREDVVGLYSDYETMVRGNGWKLVHFLGEENGQLFDLAADPDEVNNLWFSPEHAARKQELLNVILEWQIRSTHIAGQWAADYR